MDNLHPMAKSAYKFQPYRFIPKRAHLDDGAPSGDALSPEADEYMQMLSGTLPDLDAAPSAPPSIPGSAPFVAPPEAEAPDNGISPERTAALDRMKEIYGAHPERPSPKWWQRAAAAGLGAMAGYSNAASRTRHPIDASAGVQNILYPGYGARLQDWQSRLESAQGQANVEGQRQQAQETAEKIAAQADQRRAVAEWRRHQADPHANMEQIDPAYARENFPWMTPDEQGRFWVNKGTSTQLVKPAPVDRGITVTTQEFADRLGVPIGTAVDRTLYQAAIAANSKQSPNRNVMEMYAAAADGDETAKAAVDRYERSQMDRAKLIHANKGGKGGAGKTATPAQLRQVQATNDTRLAQAEGEARRAIAKINSDGTLDDTAKQAAKKAIYDGLESTKQQTQNSYENELAALGVAPRHFEYGDKRPAPQQPQNPAVAQPFRPGAPRPVRMAAPDGTIAEVPAKQVQHYKSKGAVVVP